VLVLGVVYSEQKGGNKRETLLVREPGGLILFELKYFCYFFILMGQDVRPGATGLCT
jgi:hypothetical protein